jgi:hypothetical protein
MQNDPIIWLKPQLSDQDAQCRKMKQVELTQESRLHSMERGKEALKASLQTANERFQWMETAFKAKLEDAQTNVR